MGKLINTTTMTVDAATDVGEWYVAEGIRGIGRSAGVDVGPRGTHRAGLAGVVLSV